MPEKTPFCCPEFSCRLKFSSDSWQLKHIKVHHPEHLQVECQQNLTIHSAHRRIEPTLLREFNGNKDSVNDLHAFPYLEHVEHIADSDSQPPPPTLPRTVTNSGASAPLSDYIAEQWERNTQGFLETNLQNNPYYLYATLE
jgi:hypothetical protein